MVQSNEKPQHNLEVRSARYCRLIVGRVFRESTLEYAGVSPRSRNLCGQLIRMRDPAMQALYLKVLNGNDHPTNILTSPVQKGAVSSRSHNVVASGLIVESLQGQPLSSLQNGCGAYNHETQCGESFAPRKLFPLNLHCKSY